MARRVVLVVLVSLALAVGACLDFGKFEQQGPGGGAGGSGTGAGGSGGSGAGVGGSGGSAKADGSPCAAGDECSSAQCTDGVCCDSACDGLCEACTAAKTGGTDGVCGPVTSGTNPDMDCPGNQFCDGAGTCSSTCGLKPPPPGGTCPPECTGGCNAGVCVISCASTGACSGGTIDCPANFACQVDCQAKDGCRSSTINCPDSYECTVNCGGDSSCRDSTITCSADGACDVICGTANNACNATTIGCGANACTATCNGVTMPAVTCGAACACTQC